MELLVARAKKLIVPRDEEIDRLLAPRLAHGRPPSPAYMERGRRVRAWMRERGVKWDELSPAALVAALPVVAGGATSFNVVLDTTAPGGAALALNGGAAYATARAITAALSTTDSPTTGYQIKVWGDVDTTVNTSIQATEGASSWITPSSFPANQSVTLATGDGVKNLSARIRDDVWNQTSVLTASITLDTTAPVVSIVSGPDVAKISTVSGKDVVTFGWQVDSPYQAYDVEVVSSSSSAHGTGTTIGTTNGSTNTSGNPGTGSPAPASTTVTSTVHGADLQTASSGDGTKVVKVFAQDVAGNWSV